MKYVKATKAAVEHFTKSPNIYKITEGKIYEFPEIKFDCGRFLSLQSDPKSWVKEFIFVDGPEDNTSYEIY